jgi:ABC-type dipeptide/oligopeptide/nickel transport system permease component
MKRKLIEHALSILLVTLVAGVIVVAIGERESTLRTAHVKSIEQYLHLDFIDFGDPLHRALFKETLDLFYPERLAANDSLLRAIERFRQEQFTSQAYKTGREERGLSGPRLLTLGGMYLQFIVIYLIVMVVSYHAAQSLAIFRFIRMKQHRKAYVFELYEHLRGAGRGSPSFYLRLPLVLLKAVVKGVAYAVLFAPAYVIAYSIRSGFDTNSHLFMIVLGVVSNGLLIGYTNKFFTFLVTESRKGYVQTAIVKNLHASYAWGTQDGISFTSVLRPKSLFPSHVFRHIYLNARFQYLPALKEHASFLITGLIIIEMALNIQGHLGYELMQNILYRQYDVALTVVVGIFLIVKATEISVDIWFHRESEKYENTR